MMQGTGFSLAANYSLAPPFNKYNKRKQIYSTPQKCDI